MIDPNVVSSIVRDCLFSVEELPPDNQEEWAKEHGVIIKGLVRTFAFHKERVEKNKLLILEMISQLSEKFDEGYSFLAMCEDKNGNLWTGMQTTMEELACLGEAVGVFKCVAPRELWSVLPGGVPYYQRIMK